MHRYSLAFSDSKLEQSKGSLKFETDRLKKDNLYVTVEFERNLPNENQYGYRRPRVYGWKFEIFKRMNSFLL